MGRSYSCPPRLRDCNQPVIALQSGFVILYRKFHSFTKT